MEVIAPGSGQSDDEDGRLNRLVFDLRMPLDQVVEAKPRPQEPSHFMVEPILPQEVKMALPPGFFEQSAQGFAKVGCPVIGKATTIAHLGKKLLGRK